MFLNLNKIATLAAGLSAPLVVAVAVAAAPFPRNVEPALPFAGGDLSLTETYCDLTATVSETLRHDFAEAPRLATMTGSGMKMELWISNLLGTWTLVHLGADGISCIVTSGQDWTPGSDAAALMDQALEELVHQS